MKKFVLILSFVLVLMMSLVTAYADEIIINIDSVKVEFNDDYGFPFIDENSRTLVPFRATLEKYGAEVKWNDENKTAIAVKGDITVEVPIGENYIIKDGDKIPVDTAAKVVSGRTYLPIRAVIEAFGSSVEWDSALNTVVITTEPVDAKAIYLEAGNKSYGWKNFDTKTLLNMSMSVPDETGNVQDMNISMNMDMTMFMNPFKAKIKASMPIQIMDASIPQVLIEMYMTADEKGYTTYIGSNDETGTVWMKQTIEDEMLAGLMKYDSVSIEKNKEMTEKFIKDVKYFGKYTVEGKTLLRLQYTMSGDIYKEIFGEYIKMMPEPTNEQEKMTAEMYKSLANANIGDIAAIVYVDEATGEMTKMEMDLGNMVVSLLSGMTEVFGELPEEAIVSLSSLKATMKMEIFNINKAADFSIPEDALNAKDINEMIKDLEDASN